MSIRSFGQFIVHVEYIIRENFEAAKYETKILFFKKWAYLVLFFVYFRSFQTYINIIWTANQCENISCPFNIWCRDLNPQPLKHLSSHITTRPGLKPKILFEYTTSSRTLANLEHHLTYCDIFNVWRSPFYQKHQKYFLNRNNLKKYFNSFEATLLFLTFYSLH